MSTPGEALNELRLTLEEALNKLAQTAKNRVWLIATALFTQLPSVVNYFHITFFILTASCI